jgi:hypothetical protein
MQVLPDQMNNSSNSAINPHTNQPTLQSSIHPLLEPSPRTYFATPTHLFFVPLHIAQTNKIQRKTTQQQNHIIQEPKTENHKDKAITKHNIVIIYNNNVITSILNKEKQK